MRSVLLKICNGKCLVSMNPEVRKWISNANANWFPGKVESAVVDYIVELQERVKELEQFRSEIGWIYEGRI